ncbi:MAG: YfcE family phosphodiesterase [Candidatus Thorarchaeota archaeon]
MKVLVFGDTHIPSRRDSIPSEFYNHIESTEYQMALITGDLIEEQKMRAALPPLPRSFIVRGNMDFSGRGYNRHELVQIDELKVLLIHGTQIRPRGSIEQLWEVSAHIGAEIIVHGHTHNAAIDLFKGNLFLNPGTISGATGGWSGRATASFIELKIQGDAIETRLFSTDWKTIKESVNQFQMKDDLITRV